MFVPSGAGVGPSGSPSALRTADRTLHDVALEAVVDGQRVDDDLTVHEGVGCQSIVSSPGHRRRRFPAQH